MAKRRGLRLSIKVQENVTAKLKAEQIALRGPSVARALHEGATLMRDAARALAPEDTGQLRRGVYVASMVANEYAPLVRPSTGQRLNSPLRFPPRPKQAVVVNSVFYTRWVEKGRTPRAALQGPLVVGQTRTGKWRAVGRQGGRKRGRPFFMRAIRRTRPQATAHVQRRLVQLIEGTWTK